MKHAPMIVLLLATVSAFTACSDGPAAPGSSDDSAFLMGGVHGPGMVPFKGSILLTSQPGPAPGPASDPGCAARVAADFPARIWVPIPTRTGVMDATQVGEGTIVSNGCVDVATLPFATLYAEVVITSGNGDLLHYSSEGPVNLLNPTPSGSATINGGTGRFHEATGSFDFQVVTNQNVLPVLVQFDGVISNGRSGK